MRIEPFENQRIVAAVRAIESDDIAALPVAEMKESVCQFDREIRRHVISKPGIERPGQIPFRGRVGVAQSREARVKIARRLVRDARVTKTMNCDATGTDADADEWRNAFPCPQIDVGV